ncbi:hypothetical protein HK104_009138 [Borealophlyctis nickersoniae]|nr:hypothetical protein HK104_009138 [Borealophlyctis nickersoniae]
MPLITLPETIEETVSSTLGFLNQNPVVGGLAAVSALSGLYALYQVAFPTTNVPKHKDGLPIFGSFFKIRKYAKDQTAYLYFEKVASEVGPIGRIQLLWNDLYLVTDAALAKEITGDTERFGRSKNAVATFGLVGKSTVITLEGEHWKKHRKVISAAFTNSHLTASIAEINQTIDSLFTIWDVAAASDTPVEVYTDLSTLALEALGRAVLGVDFALLARRSPTFVSRTSNGVEKAGKLLDNILAGMTRRTLAGPPSVWGFIKDGLHDDVAEMRNIVTRVIEAKQGELGKSKGGKEDLLERVLKDTENLPMEEIVDNMVLLFIAGQDTSANTMVWTLLLLAQHPDVKAKVQKEVEAVLGKSGVPCSIADVQALKYLDAVVKESLRIHSPVPVTRRGCKKATIIGGKWRIPAGAEFIINQRNAMLDETYWKDAHEFRPERWFEESAGRNPAHMPFGGGPFICVGMRFANLEMRMVLARIIQRYDFTLVPNQNLQGILTVTMGLKHGLLLNLRRR